MKEFDTAVRDMEQDVDPDDNDNAYEFTVNEKDADGKVVNKVLCHAYKPSDGQLAVLMASTGRSSSVQERIAGIVNFFTAVLDDESNAYVVGRLLDRRDDFGLAEVSQVMEWLMAEWSGHPTKSSPVSTASPPSTGQSSTESHPALI